MLLPVIKQVAMLAIFARDVSAQVSISSLIVFKKILPIEIHAKENATTPKKERINPNKFPIVKKEPSNFVESGVFAISTEFM